MSSVIKNILASENEQINEKSYDSSVLLAMLTSDTSDIPYVNKKNKSISGGEKNKSTISENKNEKIIGGTKSETITENTELLDKKLSKLLDNNTMSTANFNNTFKKQINLLGGTNKNTELSVNNTQELENKLLKLISSDDDKDKIDNNKKTYNNFEVGDVKRFFLDLKSKGVNVDIKLNDKTFSEYFDIRGTTTDINSVKFSDTSTENILNGKIISPSSITNNLLSATSDMPPITGGKSNKTFHENKLFSDISDMIKKNTLFSDEPDSLKRVIDRKLLSDTSDMPSMIGGNQLFSPTSEEFPFQDGGKRVMSAGFKAFIDFKKFVATELGIKNGPDAGAVAGAVQRDAKEQNPNEKDSVKISDIAKKLFVKNKEHYKKLLKK